MATGDPSSPNIPTTKGSAIPLNIYGPDSNTTPTVSGIHIVTALNYSIDHWNCVFDDGYGDSGTNTITISANGFDSTSATYVKGGNNNTINVTLQTSASPALTYDNIGSKIYGWYKSNPISGAPNKLYTTSTDLYLNMILYNSAGDDSTFRISSINQDGSFDIGSYISAYCFKNTNDSGQYYVLHYNPAIVGDNVYDENGGLIGTISSVDGNNISISLSNIVETKDSGSITDSNITNIENAGLVTDSNITNRLNAGGLSDITASYYSAGNTECLVLTSIGSVILKKFNLTINPTPNDSMVVFNTTPGTVSGNQLLNVLPGKNISYTVSRPQYLPITNTYLMTTQDHTENVNLVYGMYTLTINPTPEDTNVVLTADGATQIGNTISVYYGTQVYYTVSKEHYVSVSGSTTVTDTTVIPISLTLENHTITISPTPPEAVITFSTGTVSGNSCTVPYGTTVNYTATLTDYDTYSDSITVVEDAIINITLDHVANPDYAFAINEDNKAVLMKYVGTETNVEIPEWVK